jgi:outer membrane protein assembly factor BamB
MADRAITIGLCSVALVIVALAALFIYSYTSDRTGEKLWEFSDPGYYGNYSTLPDSPAVCFASYSGSVRAVSSLTGKPIWSVGLPDGERASKISIIGYDQCLAHSDNKVFLCGSGSGVPIWELTAPQPAIHAEPVISQGSLFLASSPRTSYYEMSPLRSAISATPHGTEQPEDEEDDDEKKIVSIITAADMTSGAVRWETELEDIRVGGLLADSTRVYAAGHRPRHYPSHSYSRYGASARGDFKEPRIEVDQRLADAMAAFGASERGGFEEPSEEASDKSGETEEEEESLGVTQLWALNADTGKPEWKLDATGDFRVSPAMTDEGIVFATDENVYLVSPHGREKWKFPLANRTAYSLKAHEGKLLVSTSGGTLKCLDLQSGHEKWTVLTGTHVDKIAVSDQLVCVPGLVEVNREPRKVIPTKRWEGSEDLLEKALKSTDSEYEPILLALDIESGDTLWTKRKIDGELKYADGVLYTLRHTTRMLFMDASVDPSDIAKTVSNLSAFDVATGEKLWETGIDGRASDLRLAAGAALMISRPEQMSIASDTGGPVSVRMIAISLQ